MREGVSRFWVSVDQCDHERMSQGYLVDLSCSTPYCRGREEHCLDCGAYISSCGCGHLDGVSGWSKARWTKYQRRRGGRKDA
jgi:hypothetical protein